MKELKDNSMHRKEYIDVILDDISDKFDIYHNYWFDNRRCVIYAYHYGSADRYDSTSDAKLADLKEYEHLFFVNCDNLTYEAYEDLYNFAVDKLEPHFVRGDNKLPGSNHMYSYISFIIISKHKPGMDVTKAIEQCNYQKKYAFGMRGFCKLRFACVTPSERDVICNKSAIKLGDFLRQHFDNNASK